MAPPPMDHRSEADPAARADIRARVADLRREIENLRASLDNIEAAAAKGAEQLATSLVVEAKVLDRENGPFESSIEKLRAELGEHPLSARSIDGAITSIQNNWERALDHWPRVDATGKAPRAEDVLAATATARLWLKAANFEAAMTTVPADLASWVKVQRLLEPLDFHATFARDLPDKDDRDKMLRYLASAPDAYRDAYIDVDTGRIYRTSARLPDVARSYLLFVAIIVIGGLIVAGLSSFKIAGLGDDIPVPAGAVAPDPMITWLWAYAAIVVGAVAHMLIDIFKARDNEKVFNNMGVSGPLLWGHAKEWDIVKALAPLWIGPIVMKTLGDDTVLTGLFIGYSFDSILDLALRRFDKTMAIGAEDLQKRADAALAAEP